MSDEQRNEETEVEAHKTAIHASDEPRDEAETDERGRGPRRGRRSASGAQRERRAEDEVEGHVHKANHPKYS